MRVLTLFLALLFSAPDTTFAQCGWILWRKSTTILEGNVVTEQIPNWAPQEGFDQLAICNGAASGALKGTVSALRESHTVSSASVHPGERSATLADDSGGRKHVWELEFVCFPGGFDPRKPAGGQ